jgi:hypothetical protein
VEHPGYQGYDFDICQGGSGSYVQGPAVQAKDTQDTIYYKGQKWSHATEDGLQGEYEIKAMRSVEDDQEKKIDYVYGQVIVSLYHDRESNHNVTPAQSKTACGQNFLGSERNYIYNAIPECYFGAGELNGQKVICEADPPPISFSFNSYADDITDYKVVEITLLGANYLFSLGFLEAKEAPSPVFDRPLFSSLQVILEQGQDQGLNWLKYFYQSNYTNGLSCLGVGYHTEADGWYYLQNAGNSQSYAIGKYVKTAQDSQGSSYQFANVFSTGEVYQGSGYSGTSSGYFSFNPTAILHPTLWSQYGNLSQGNFYSTYYSPFWILNQGSSLLMDFY